MEPRVRAVAAQALEPPWLPPKGHAGRSQTPVLQRQGPRASRLLLPGKMHAQLSPINK